MQCLCALERHKVSRLVGNVDWVKCVECEDDVEEDERWYHVDCLRLKGVDLENEGFVSKM